MHTTVKLFSNIRQNRFREGPEIGHPLTRSINRTTQRHLVLRLCTPHFWHSPTNQLYSAMPPPVSAATGPPQPGEIDLTVALFGGTSVAIEATPQCMQQTKSLPAPTLTETVAQLTRDNGRLRAELAHAQEKCAALSHLAESVTKIAVQLEQTLLGLRTTNE